MAILLTAPLMGVGRIVYDATNAAILSETNADASFRPASLAKLMTAYVAFQALAAGELAPNARVTVSRHAARTSPVKLGLSPGARPRFQNALAAAVVGSSNDMAVVVAEAVSGTEAAFVARMNTEALRLGMTRTEFRNPHGLPSDQPARTTARDIAILAAALARDHPGRLSLFVRSGARAGGRSVMTTNPLIGGFTGIEGLKTGYTCAAGYSIAAMATRGGRRIIAVTLGHPRKRARNADIRAMLRAAFDQPVPPSDARTVLQSAPAIDIAPADVGACGARRSSSSQRAAIRRTAPRPPRRTRQAATPPPRPSLGGWSVFLGAEPNAAAAVARLNAARGYAPPAASSGVLRRPSNGAWAAAISGMNKPTAFAACQRLQAAGRYCLVLSPQTTTNPRARWRR